MQRLVVGCRCGQWNVAVAGDLKRSLDGCIMYTMSDEKWRWKDMGCLNDFITMSTETTIFNTSQVLRFRFPSSFSFSQRSPGAVLRFDNCLTPRSLQITIDIYFSSYFSFP
jgi:hypothetical protein